jgi:60 kDa SS-A/Ro ribonucleoprotein
MVRINAPVKKSRRVSNYENVPQTHEGAPAAYINAEQQLRRLVLPCLMWENTFYVNGKEISKLISDAVKNVSGSIAARVAIDAREKNHMRHVPLWVLREMARHHSGTSIVSETLARIIQRPDEMGEALAQYYKDDPERKQPLSVQFKKGLAKAILKFDRYQLAKYAQRSGLFKLRDVIFLAHPNPNDSEIEDGDKLTAERVEKRYAGQKTLTKSKTSPKIGAKLRKAEALFVQLAQKEISAKDAGTWESKQSQRAKGLSKGDVWTQQLKSGKLGYMALLRNLRNMVEAGVDRDLIETAILARKGARRVLPFRYVAAARAVPSLEATIDKALHATIKDMQPLTGETWALVDVSDSMNFRLSTESDLTRMDAAAALAAIIPGKVRMFSFSHRLVEVPARRGMAGIDAIKSSQPHAGTYLGKALQELNERMSRENVKGRLIVVSDEQSHDPVGDPWIDTAYMINVASYQNGVAYGKKWVNISGFSEGVLKYIAALENMRQWTDDRDDDEVDDYDVDIDSIYDIDGKPTPYEG